MFHYYQYARHGTVNGFCGAKELCCGANANVVCFSRTVSPRGRVEKRMSLGLGTGGVGGVAHTYQYERHAH